MTTKSFGRVWNASVRIIASGWILAGMGLSSVAAPLAPNPNPVGNTINLGSLVTNSEAFYNYGDVVVNGTTTLSNFASGTITNVGQFTVYYFGNLSMNNGTFNNDGTIQAAGTISISNMTFANAGFFVSQRAVDLYASQFNNTGTFSGGLSLTGGATASNSGSFSSSLSGGIYLQGQQVFSNDGDLYCTSSGGVYMQGDGVFNNSGTYTTYSSGGVFMLANGVFNNTGTFVSESSGGVSGGTVYNEGLLSAQVIHANYVRNDGTIEYFQSSNTKTYTGHGTTVGDFVDGGLLAPGDLAAGTPGVYTIDGNYQKNGGTLGIAIDGTSDGGNDLSQSEFSWVRVTGNVDILYPSAIALTASPLSVGQLVEGTRLSVMRFSGDLTGFDMLTLNTTAAPLAHGLNWQLSLGTNSVDVVIVPEPSTLALAMAAASVVALMLRRPKAQADTI